METLARWYPNKDTITKKFSVLHNPINSDLDLGHWKIITLLLGALQCSDDFDFDTAETLYNVSVKFDQLFVELVLRSRLTSNLQI